MAIAKYARVVRAEWIGYETRLVELATDEPLGFIGGQYVIVDSGLTLESGRLAKRAYSILSSDAEQTRFQLAALRIPGGRCSMFMHQLDVGDEVKFSGPWGKLYPTPDATGNTLVLATDTGISAALGLVRSQQFEPLLPTTTLIWLRMSPSYFLADSFVRSVVPATCGELRIAALPPIGHVKRVPSLKMLLAEEVARRPLARAFITGDGAVNYALLPDLIAAGIPATKDSLESFFNMPAAVRRVDNGELR
jgi:ferredoxin-NADP reductase